MEDKIKDQYGYEAKPFDINAKKKTDIEAITQNFIVLKIEGKDVRLPSIAYVQSLENKLKRLQNDNQRLTSQYDSLQSTVRNLAAKLDVQ